MATRSRSAWIEAWEGDLVPTPAAVRSATRTSVRVRSSRYYGREATARQPQPALESGTTQAPPKLKVVARRRPRWPLIALALVFAAALLGVAVISPMLVSSAVTDIESAVGRAEAKERALTADNTALASKISALSAPDRVAEQAARLGLEPAEDVSYVAPGRSATATEGGTTLAVR